MFFFFFFFFFVFFFFFFLVVLWWWPPAAGDVEAVGILALGDVDGDVALGLAQQPLADDARLHLVALAPGQRAVIDAERDGKGGRVDRPRRDRGGDGRHADGVGDGGGLEPGDGDDVARVADIDGGALEAAEGQHLGDATLLDLLALAVEGVDGIVGPDGAGGDAAGQYAAEERIALDGGDQHAERPLLHLRGGDIGEHLVEQRRHRLARPGGIGGHPAVAAGPVEHRKIELLGGGVERDEQVEDLFQHLEVPLVRAVDLVDRDDRPQPARQRLGQHELGLRHRPLGGVHQDDDAVDHGQDALHLAAEIGVAGGVDDVDAGLLPHQRSDLGEDGDATLAFEVARIHRPLLDPLVVAEGAGLTEQHVDESGLAMIDVGNNGDIAQRHFGPPGGREDEGRPIAE